MEEADTAVEIIHVDKALGRCGYPKWSFRRVRESMDKKKQEGRASKKKKEEDDRDTKTAVTIPYVKGVLESLSWVFRHHSVALAMKPHLTLKRMLVHPKDKRTPQGNAGVVYQVPCKDCLVVYTGETERRYGFREKEDERDLRSLEEVKFTWARKKDSVSEVQPSTITDHVTRNNYTIDWEGRP